MKMEELLILPSESEQKIVWKERNFDEDKLKHDFDALLEWLSYQKHLPQNIGRNCLRNYLIGCKGNLEKAKKKIVNYCYAPIVYEELLCGRDISDTGDLRPMEHACVLPLPKLAPDGSRITIFKDFDGDKLDLFRSVRYWLLMIDFRLHKDIIMMGEIIIVDMQFIKASHYAKLFNNTMIRFLKQCFACYPSCLTKAFIITQSTILENGVNWVKKCFTEKMASRITIINNSEELLNYLPSSCLPTDYGGTEKSIKDFTVSWRKLLMDNEHFYQELSQMKATGPVPDEVTNYDSGHGVSGNFRQLNID